MRASISLLFILVVLGVVGSGFYIVPPSDQVILTQFGEPIGDPVTEEGLHFKIPVIQVANVLDRRILEWDGASIPMQTRDKRFIQVDTFARWRIDDPLLFFQRLQSSRRAESRLDDILGGETMKAVANHELVEMIRSTKGREPMGAEEGITTLEPIREGRNAIESLILAQARKEVAGLGIELLDIRFKRVNYKDQEVIRGIFDRMSSERKQIADQIRSEGEGEASRILGRMDRELKEIESAAYRKVQEISGAAEAESTRIYAEAYNQSPESVDFYSFLRTMEIYRQVIGKDTTLVLSTNSDLFDQLKAVDPKKGARLRPARGEDFSPEAELPLFLRDN